MPNRHPDTGIAYGVIAMNSLQSWVWDEFYAHGTDLSFRDAMAEFDAEHPGADEDERQEFIDNLQIDEPEWELSTDGMRLGISWLGGAPLLWVFESPHTAECRQCSPCVPGAGDLDHLEDGGMVAYTVPDEWRTKD